MNSGSTKQRAGRLPKKLDHFNIRVASTLVGGPEMNDDCRIENGACFVVAQPPPPVNFGSIGEPA
jgi:hypothetical protein